VSGRGFDERWSRLVASARRAPRSAVPDPEPRYARLPPPRTRWRPGPRWALAAGIALYLAALPLVGRAMSEPLTLRLVLPRPPALPPPPLVPPPALPRPPGLPLDRAEVVSLLSWLGFPSPTGEAHDPR